MSRPTSDAGQATVEVALAVPLLVLILLTGLQFALVVRDQIGVIAAAREASRAAAASDGLASAAAQAAARATNLEATRRTVSVSTSGGLVTVVVSYRSPTKLPLVGVLLPDITVRGTATMAIES